MRMFQANEQLRYAIGVLRGEKFVARPQIRVQYVEYVILAL